MDCVSSNVLDDYEKISESNGWMKLFFELKRVTNYKYDSNESFKTRNKYLNRYYDVVPYDHSRVVLEALEPTGSGASATALNESDVSAAETDVNSDSEPQRTTDQSLRAGFQSPQEAVDDYINANYVEIKNANRRYILTQGPLSMTIGHFWQMVWQERSEAIIMLNKIVEKKQLKCIWYWPTDCGDTAAMTLDNGLVLQMTACEDRHNFHIRRFEITNKNTNETRTVTQFHYVMWPDFGVPSSPTAFIEFLSEIRREHLLDNPKRPAVVHCSAGIGRSGTFSLVDSCLVLIEKNGIENVNVCDVLKEMRKYRMGLIQTAEQLQFSFMAIIEGAKTLLNLELAKTYDFDAVTAAAVAAATTNRNDSDMDTEMDVDSTSLIGECELPPPVPPRRSFSLDLTPPTSKLPSSLVSRTAAVAAATKPLPSVPDQHEVDEEDDESYEDDDEEDDDEDDDDKDDDNDENDDDDESDVDEIVSSGTESVDVDNVGAASVTGANDRQRSNNQKSDNDDGSVPKTDDFLAKDLRHNQNEIEETEAHASETSESAIETQTVTSNSNSNSDIITATPDSSMIVQQRNRARPKNSGPEFARKIAEMKKRSRKSIEWEIKKRFFSKLTQAGMLIFALISLALFYKILV